MRGKEGGGIKEHTSLEQPFYRYIKVRPVVSAGAHRTRFQNTSMWGESSQGGEGLDWVLYIRIVFSCFRAFGANTFVCRNESHEREHRRAGG